MDNKKDFVLITGAAGNIGKHLIKKISDKYTIIGLDITELHDPKAYFVPVDLGSDTSVREAFKRVGSICDGKLASVIHLAAYYKFSKGYWDKYQQITIEGTRRILQNLETFDVGQFAFSSTLLVYKPCKPGEKINEESPVDPKWEYPLSKVKTEQLLFEQKGKFPLATLRIAGVYTDECNSVPLSHQIKRIDRKELESYLFPGNPEHGSSFLHRDDLIDAIELLIDKRKDLKEEEIFVLGEDKTYGYKTLQHELGVLIRGKPWPTFRVPKWCAKLGAYAKKLLDQDNYFIEPWMIDIADAHYELDISHAQKSLGWQPKRDLKDTLPKMVEDLKKDRQSWYQRHHF